MFPKTSEGWLLKCACYEELFLDIDNLVTAAEYARQRGWHTMGYDMDRCPKCQKKHNNDVAQSDRAPETV